MNAMGIVLPALDDLPEIVFHDRNDAFPGETLKKAFDAGAHFFESPPRIIFVLLPDTGEPAPPFLQTLQIPPSPHHGRQTLVLAHP